MTIRIGTSGWVYAHWRGILYPPGLGQAHWLEHYSEQFDTVEINGSFYRLPKPAAFARWADAAPGSFIYAVKAPMWGANLTWFVKSRQSAEAFLGPMRKLGPHLGPVLYQLPRQRKIDMGLLDAFVAKLPRDINHVFEFRHDSWFVPEVERYLARKKLAFCIHDHRATDCTSPFWVTAKTVYWRFHGNMRSKKVRYGEAAIAAAARRIRGYARKGHDVYVYFNNDTWGSALVNAKRLRTIVGV